MLFDKLADKIIKHPKHIVIAWIIIILCAAPLAINASDVLKYDMQDVAVEESESIIGLKMINEKFYDPEISMTDSPLLVLQTDSTPDKAEQGFQKIEDLLSGGLSSFVDEDGNQKVISLIYTGVLDPENNGNKGALAIINVVYNPEFKGIQKDTPELREYVSGILAEYAKTEGAINVTTYVTGGNAMNYDVETGVMADLAKIDPVTILLILVLIGLFFRSVISATTPPITIGFAFGVTLALVFILGPFMEIFFITQMLILVTMMGAGCDYCIFILARYKEERRAGAEHEKALRNSVVWAGESIATSGATVIIGFGSISLFSVPMVSTMGIVLAIGILIALIAALTLITSLISIFGDRMFWPSNAETYKKGSKAMNGWYGKFARFGDKYFRASARFSQRNAGVIAVAAVLVTIPALYVVTTAETSYDFMGTLSTGESYDGLQEIDEYVGGGFLQPNYILLEFDESIADVTFNEYGLPAISWNANRVNEIASLTDTISPSNMDNISSAWSIVKWENLLYLAEAQFNVIIDEMDIADHIPGMFYDFIEGHAVAGLALKSMPTDSLPYAMMSLQTLGLDEDLLEAMNVMMNGGSFEDLLGPMIEYAANHPDPNYQLTVANMGAQADLMDFSINYLGGILGGEQTETGYSLNFVKLTAITTSSATSIRSMDTVSEINGVVDDFVASHENVSSSWITGMPAVTYDLSNSVGDEFKYIGVIVVVLILLLLFFVMKSYTIPFRSLITIGMSVVWTIALTHVLFTNILGIDVIWLVPMILFIVCLGLGMDYDILLTTRIKENATYRGMDNDTAISEAVIHTGSVITICGLIMGGAFGTLMLSSMPMMQEFGFSLCVAILIDALLVRTYLVPAVMHLLGKWNWIGPKWLQKGSGRIQ
jgi:RND superfamily putative drug exporter